MAWTLCTKGDVTTFHPISEDQLQDSWSEIVEGLIKNHMGSPNLGDSVAITDEHHNGDGTSILRVYKPPIISVEDVSLSGASFSADDYVVFDTYIQLKSGTFKDGTLNIKVSYTSGSAEIPQDARLAAISMIIAIINYQGKAGADSSIKWGNTQTQKGERSLNITSGLIGHLNSIMEGIIKRPVVRAV